MALIEVTHVTKEFRLGQLCTFKDGLRRLLSGRDRKAPTVPFKALDDVNFSVEGGEVLGIVGTNGAGKSTLLKILSQIIVPTRGTTTVRGKVAPLIELGAGLVGDLTGRENIFLNAALLGVSRREITKRFEEIVEFAELAPFIDTPLKRYSSGMQVRLGFSIATSVNADILVVDEVLAVGDLAFQRKSFDRMESLIRREGRTVLVVGHNLRQLERLCSRIIVLDHGRVINDGTPAESCKLYIELTNRKSREYVTEVRTRHDQIMRSEELDVDLVATYGCGSGEAVNEFEMGESLRVGINFRAHRKIRNVEVVVGIHTTDFVYIASASTATPGISLSFAPGSHYIECFVDELGLLPGVYAIRVSFLDKNSRALWYGENLSFFSVNSGKTDPSRLPVLGFVNLAASWRQSPSSETAATTMLPDPPTIEYLGNA